MLLTGAQAVEEHDRHLAGRVGVVQTDPRQDTRLLEAVDDTEDRFGHEAWIHTPELTLADPLLYDHREPFGELLGEPAQQRCGTRGADGISCEGLGEAGELRDHGRSCGLELAARLLVPVYLSQTARQELVQELLDGEGDEVVLAGCQLVEGPSGALQPGSYLTHSQMPEALADDQCPERIEQRRLSRCGHTTCLPDTGLQERHENTLTWTIPMTVLSIAIWYRNHYRVGMAPRLNDARRMAAAGTTFLRAARRGRVRARTNGEPWRPVLADELRHGFEHLGPTYVKLGQMVASTPGMFPEFLVEGMQGCLDEVRPISISEVRGVIHDELGGPPDEVFAAFDETPLASASIGQVHRATTPEGTEVVVKVQRPNITDLISTDLRILRSMARGAERTTKYARLMQPVAIVDDFTATLSSELSFMVEARSMEAVQAGLSDFPDAARIHIPAVDWRYTTARVLTMEYVDGTRLDDVNDLLAQGVDPADLLRAAVRSWMHGTLVHGVFHGDLHAGNLLVDKQGRATFLDFGICGRLTPSARESLFLALPALLGRDFASLAAALFTAPDGTTPEDLPAITADLERALVPVLDAPLGEVSYAQAFVEVVRVGMRHGVLLPNDLILVFKQFFYVERFTRLLAPEWQPLNDPELLSQIMAATSTRAA